MHGDDPHRFFAERGFALSFHREGDQTWADLVSHGRGERWLPWLFRPRLIRKYGVGRDEPTAAQSAQRRWLDEGEDVGR